MLTQNQFQSLLVPQLYHFFNVGQNMVPSMRSQLFTIQPTSFATIYGQGIGGISPDAWDQWAVAGKKATLDFSQLYPQTYSPQRFPVQLVIDKKLLINEQYPIISGSMRKAGVSAEQKMENDAASLLNNAFDNTNYKLSDGVCLCSASHPAGPDAGTKVFSNLGTLTLSNQSISDTRVLMMRQKDDKGNVIGLMPDELWVPPELEDVAIKAVGGPSDPTTADRANNPQASRWTIKPWLRLSNTKNWFMVDSTQRKLAVNWYEREAFQTMLIDETLTELTYELMLHYAFGTDDWRWVYGNKPA